MIPHSAFGQLRLAALLPEEMIWEIEGYELLDRLWVMQGFSAFTTAGALTGEPDVTRVMEVHFGELTTIQRLMAAIKLPARAGMSTRELAGLLGKPNRELLPLKDRVSYEFVVGPTTPTQSHVPFCTTAD